jgi:chromosome segregation ATPase
MRKNILNISVGIFMAGTFFISCQSSAKKVENAENKLQDAKENVVDAKKKLNQALADSIQNFRKISEERILANENKYAELRSKIASEKKEKRAKYETKLAKLEQTNRDLKQKLANYKEEQKDKWEIFKSGYNRDMNELDNEFKSLKVKNSK